MNFSKKWFYRLLLSYLPIFFIVTFIIILIAFIIISDLIQKETEKANKVYAEHVMQNIDYALRSIDQLMIKELHGNDVLLDFFGQKDPDRYWAHSQSSAQLRNFHRISPLIGSVYLYRHSDQMVLSRHTMLPYHQFGDKQFISSVLEENVSSNWTNIRMHREFMMNSEPQPVVSLIRKVPLLSGSNGFMVVNIPTKNIQSLIDRTSSSNINFVHLIDRSGQPIVETNHNNEEELSTVYSNYTGWQLNSGIKAQGFFDFVSFISYIWISVAVATLMMGVVWIIYVTRKNYQPLASVIETVYSFSKEKSRELMKQANPDEFKFIQSALETLMEQSNQYEKQHEQNLSYRRQHLFKELLEGNRPITLEEWKEEMHILKINGHFHTMVVSLIEIDEYLGFCNRYSHQDQYLLKYVLSSVVNEVALHHSVSVWTEWVSDSRLGLLYKLTADQSADQCIVKQLSTETIKWVESKLDFTITIGIGSTVNQIDEICQSYDNAMEALAYKITLGGNRVIDRDDVTLSPQGEITHYLPLLGSTAQLFRLGDHQWKHSINIFFKEIRNGFYSNQDMKSLLRYMIYHFHREMNGLAEQYQEIWNHKALPHLYDVLDQLDTLDAIQSRFLNILTETSEEMKARREVKSHNQLMKEVKKYIECNYANPDISLNYLSSEFDINPNYLSRMFKEELGEKFVDYLVRIRIEHAKRLLKESSDSVQHIAIRVGYTHSVSFIRMFKKVEGITPGEFRKEIS